MVIEKYSSPIGDGNRENIAFNLLFAVIIEKYSSPIGDGNCT